MSNHLSLFHAGGETCHAAKVFQQVLPSAVQIAVNLPCRTPEKAVNTVTMAAAIMPRSTTYSVMAAPSSSFLSKSSKLSMFDTLSSGVFALIGLAQPSQVGDCLLKSLDGQRLISQKRCGTGLNRAKAAAASPFLRQPYLLIAPSSHGWVRTSVAL